jgi:hypothetical protein
MRTEPQPSNLQPIILFNEENRAHEFISLYSYLSSNRTMALGSTQPLTEMSTRNLPYLYLFTFTYSCLYLWAHTGANDLISKSKISEWMTAHSTMTYQSNWVITSQVLPTIYYHTVLFVCIFLLQLLFEWWVWCQGLANTNIVGLQDSWSCNTQDTKLHESKQVYVLHLTLFRTKQELCDVMASKLSGAQHR